MKYKLFSGLFGCDYNGELYTPSGKFIIKLPKIFAFKTHKFLNSLSYVGMENTKLLWRKV